MVMTKHINGGDSVSASNTSNNGAILRPQGHIRKFRKPEDVQLFLRRLKQYLLYSKLRSLIPSTQEQQQQEQPFEENHQIGGIHDEEATEVEIELHEIPIVYKSDSEHEDQEHIHVIAAPSGHDLMLETKEQEQDEDVSTCNTIFIYETDDEEGGICKTTIVFENDEPDQEEKQPEKEFAPTVTIERMGDTILINTMVLKQEALTSTLFKIFEDEKLDIVFENQYRTETKVCHTIQVRLSDTGAGHQCIVDKLEKKLQIWANGEPESML